MQFGPVRQDNRVAGQSDAEEGLGNLADVGAEHLRLGAGGGQEYLVAAGQHRIFQRLAGEVVGHADLAGFKDIASTRQRRVVLGLPTAQLIAKQGTQPLGKVIARQVADLVLALLAALPLAAAIMATASAWGSRRGGFVSCFTLGLQGLLALGPLDGLLFEADMVADQPVQFVQLGAGFLLTPEQRLHPAGNSILHRLFGQQVTPAVFLGPEVDHAAGVKPQFVLDLLGCPSFKVESPRGIADLFGIRHGTSIR